ncbi:MAG: hypothetical protein ACRCSM_01775 [Sediminibacterium sp.]|jgi:hypothetical protein|nr:hypothetical protein [Chitinophagaceae bacterium]MCA6446300.1 hypothetical protein [Chitinophagaceae bacterium]
MKKIILLMAVLSISILSKSQILLTSIEPGFGLDVPSGYNSSYSADVAIKFPLRVDIPLLFFHYSKKNPYGFKVKAMYQSEHIKFTHYDYSLSDFPILKAGINTIAVKVMPFTYLTSNDVPLYTGSGVVVQAPVTTMKTEYSATADEIRSGRATVYTKTTEWTTTNQNFYLSSGDVNLILRSLFSIYFIKGTAFIHTTEPNKPDQHITADVTGWGFNPTFEIKSGLTFTADFCFGLKYKWATGNTQNTISSMYAGMGLGIALKGKLHKK